MHPDAKDGKDNLDAMRVPRFVKYTDITFNHEEFWYPWFSGDVVPREELYTWEFEANNNTGEPVLLKWDNSFFGENEYQLFLEDMENGKIISMRESNFYGYEADSLREFKVHYGTTEKLSNELPLGVALDTSYPNPFISSTVIPFTLPEKDGIFNVRLEIFDFLGHQIEVLMDNSLPSGIHKVEWDGLDATGNSVDEGLYIILLKISSDKVNATFSQKIMKR